MKIKSQNMSDKNKPMTVQAAPVVVNPFARQRAEHLNAGTVEIESQRAIAEVQGAITVAKARPRDEAQSFERMTVSCQRLSFANTAMYAYPRGGKSVTGPSIRLAEELARLWGNIDYGIRELSQRDTETEMEAYCWDLETNVRSSQRFVVKHERHTNKGVQSLTDPRDIYELGANNGARRLRARILAVLPPDYVESAVELCKRTVASGGGAVPFADRIKNMIAMFNQLGVSKAHIESRIKKPVTELLPDEFVELTTIYTSLRDGHSKPSDWFGLEKTPDASSPVAGINANLQPVPAAQNETVQGATQGEVKNNPTNEKEELV